MYFAEGLETLWKGVSIMKTFAAGREIEIPTDSNSYVDVQALKRALNVPSGRALIQQERSGENTVLPEKGRIQLKEYSHFTEAPRARRG